MPSNEAGLLIIFLLALVGAFLMEEWRYQQITQDFLEWFEEYRKSDEWKGEE